VFIGFLQIFKYFLDYPNILNEKFVEKSKTIKFYPKNQSAFIRLPYSVFFIVIVLLFYEQICNFLYYLKDVRNKNRWIERKYQLDFETNRNMPIAR